MAVRRVIVAIRRFVVPQSQYPVIEPALRKYLTKEKGFTEEQVCLLLYRSYVLVSFLIYFS